MLEVLRGQNLYIRDGKIEKTVSEQEKIPSGYRTVDVQGGYILPGLINMHVHLVPSSKPSKDAKPAGYKVLKKKMQSHPHCRRI